MAWAAPAIQLLCRFRSMRFGRSAMLLVSLTAFAQAIPLLSSPILTRMFSPGDFGVLGLYMAGLALASITATGRYDLTIMLADREEDAEALVMLSVAISLALGLGGALIVALWQSDLATAVGRPDLGLWLFAMPAGLAMIGVYNALMQWLNRHGLYRRMGWNRVLQTGITAVASIALGLAGLSYPALVGGALIGLAVTTAMLVVQFFPGRTRRLLGRDGRSRSAAAARAFSNYPLHVFPAQWIGVLAMQLPVFIVSANFGSAAAGFYHLAYRVIAVPGSLIGGAIGDVYRQHAVEAHRATGRFDSLFRRTFAGTFAMGLVPLIVLILFAPALFDFVFGDEWRVAGEYARILSLGAFAQFACLPVDKSAMITRRTGYILAWNVLVAILVAVLGALVIASDLSITTFLLLYSAGLALMYFGDSLFQYRFSRDATASRDAAL